MKYFFAGSMLCNFCQALNVGFSNCVVSPPENQRSWLRKIRIAPVDGSFPCEKMMIGDCPFTCRLHLRSSVLNSVKTLVPLVFNTSVSFSDRIAYFFGTVERAKRRKKTPMIMKIKTGGVCFSRQNENATKKKKSAMMSIGTKVNFL